MDGEHEQYARGAWARFHSQPERALATLRAVEGHRILRALDVGCGGGQELSPFVLNGALGVGIDFAPETGLVGRKLFKSQLSDCRVVFARASGDALPFCSEVFDVVICRLALPYMYNTRALSEFARVLRTGGLLFLKIHHARFYLDKFLTGLTREPLSSVHSVRVGLSSLVYHLTGYQPSDGYLIKEVFQTVSTLRRELVKYDLKINHEMPDSNPLTPSFCIAKSSD